MTKKFGAIFSIVSIIAFVAALVSTNFATSQDVFTFLYVVILSAACMTIIGLRILDSASLPLWIFGVIVVYACREYTFPIDATIQNYILIGGYVLIGLAIVIAIVDIVKALIKKEAN